MDSWRLGTHRSQRICSPLILADANGFVYHDRKDFAVIRAQPISLFIRPSACFRVQMHTDDWLGIGLPPLPD